MPKQIDFTLHEKEVAALERAIKTDQRSGVARRATAVRLLHLGYKAAEVAQMVSASEPSVYAWHERFRQRGVDGLANQVRQQPARKVSEEYIRQLEAALAQEPAAYGYDFAIWTRERLLAHLEAVTGIRVHVSWLQQLLKALGYVYRRPKHDLRQRQDASAKAAAQAELDVLKKTLLPTSIGSSLWMKPP